MKQRIDWLNHGLEFVVVIVGILIAFQLNQCAIDKNQKKIKENFDFIEYKVQPEKVYTNKLFQNILSVYKRTNLL